MLALGAVAHGALSRMKSPAASAIPRDRRPVGIALLVLAFAVALLVVTTPGGGSHFLPLLPLPFWGVAIAVLVPSIGSDKYQNLKSQHWAFSTDRPLHSAISVVALISYTMAELLFYHVGCFAVVAFFALAIRAIVYA